MTEEERIAYASALRKTYRRKYYLENKEWELEKCKARYDADPQKKLAMNLAYREAHPEWFDKYEKEYYREHKEQYARSVQVRKERDPEGFRKAANESANKSYEKHKEKRIAQQKERRLTDEYKVKRKKYYEEHREDYLTNYRNRRLRILNAEGSHTTKEVREMWEAQCHKCKVPGCTQPIAASGKHKFHLDHIEPIIRGGTNWISNCQILCSNCNHRKHAKEHTKWLKDNGLASEVE